MDWKHIQEAVLLVKAGIIKRASLDDDKVLIYKIGDVLKIEFKMI